MIDFDPFRKSFFHLNLQAVNFFPVISLTRVEFASAALSSNYCLEELSVASLSCIPIATFAGFA